MTTESGVAGVESNPWHAVAAPKGTPGPIIDKLNAEVRLILDLADVRAKLEGFGLKIQTGTPAEMKEMMDIVTAGKAEPVPVIKRKLDEANATLTELSKGLIMGRAVLIP